MYTLQNQIDYTKNRIQRMDECNYKAINKHHYDMTVAILKTLETVKLLHERKTV